MQTTADLKDFETLALACKALSHPARLAIRGVCICGEIVEVMPLSQATVSQHLKVLREAGLIRGEIDGPRCCYCIDDTKMRELRERIEQLFSSLESCCR
ncbi:MAG: metalloregulator ArsR/SmtB family transcription factor [Xanthomonadales bacterium]|nr:metalloregulator ArsR/SmtB family transcription factor [Xanthomonadales bacterium]